MKGNRGDGPRDGPRPHGHRAGRVREAPESFRARQDGPPVAQRGFVSDQTHGFGRLSVTAKALENLQPESAPGGPEFVVCGHHGHEGINFLWVIITDTKVF